MQREKNKVASKMTIMSDPNNLDGRPKTSQRLLKWGDWFRAKLFAQLVVDVTR